MSEKISQVTSIKVIIHKIFVKSDPVSYTI